jgi:hypothetical protein
MTIFLNNQTRWRKFELVAHHQSNSIIQQIGIELTHKTTRRSQGMVVSYFFNWIE